MKNSIVKNLWSGMSFLALLALPVIADAQYFTDTAEGDVNLGFRKTGTAVETPEYEMVAYLGNITNFMSVPQGTTINITNYLNQQITNAFANNLNNLQWSVFSSFANVSGLTTSNGIFSYGTMWYTVPRTTAGVQTTPAARFAYSNSGLTVGHMLGVSSGAANISSSPSFYTSTNIYNNINVVLEPIAQPLSTANDQYSLSANIGDNSGSDQYNIDWGDFNADSFMFTVENTTPSSFTAATVSDFYVNVPQRTTHPITDPLTGLTSGNADYLGYFTFNSNGTMTFTRASAAVAPAITSAGASSATNGFSPLSVVFTNTATGTITNYVWNFGNGTSITNTTGASVTNTYTTGGDYTVTLTVYGPGGSASEVLANYIVASPKPKLSSVVLSNGKLVLGGTNAPAGVQYRILMATNLTSALASWTPVLTNTVSALGNFGYTNSAPTNKTAFFRLVSP